MTVICFDGKTLACDSLRTAEYRDAWNITPKFVAVRKGVIAAAAGEEAWSSEFLAWAKNPRKKFPVTDAPTSEGVIFRSGKWLRYLSNSAHPERMGVCWQIGSGAPYAASAQILGHSAVAACWAAMQLDPNCGGSIFAAELSDMLKRGEAAIDRRNYSRQPFPQ